MKQFLFLVLTPYQTFLSNLLIESSKPIHARHEILPTKEHVYDIQLYCKKNKKDTVFESYADNLKSGKVKWKYEKGKRGLKRSCAF